MREVEYATLTSWVNSSACPAKASLSHVGMLQSPIVSRLTQAASDQSIGVRFDSPVEKEGKMGKYKCDPVLAEVMDDLFSIITHLDQATRARHLPPPILDGLIVTKLKIFKLIRRLNQTIEKYLEVPSEV